MNPRTPEEVRLSNENNQLKEALNEANAKVISGLKNRRIEITESSLESMHIGSLRNEALVLLNKWKELMTRLKNLEITEKHSEKETELIYELNIVEKSIETNKALLLSYGERD